MCALERQIEQFGRAKRRDGGASPAHGQISFLPTVSIAKFRSAIKPVSAEPTRNVVAEGASSDPAERNSITGIAAARCALAASGHAAAPAPRRVRKKRRRNGRGLRQRREEMRG